MTIRRNTIACMAALLALASCSKLDKTVDTAQDNIASALKNQGVYERHNLPDDPTPTPDKIKGYFDIVRGAYRHIANEDRENRGSGPVIAVGDSISFMFDGRIFTGGNFESQQTFYTNIASRIKELTGNNPGFTGAFWPTEPLRIKVGDDRRILKSLQTALISCVAGNGDPSDDDLPDGVASDRVRVYLTPDLAFGNRVVYNVPSGSTLVFEVTDIEIIK